MRTESSIAFRHADSAGLVRPNALTTAIAEVTKRWCVEQYRERLRALVLTGSLARAEGTFVPEGEYWNLLGDGEFLLIFRERARLPAAADLSRLCGSIEEELQRQRIRCHLSLNAAHPTYLQRLKPHIFAYELGACGQVIWGEPNVLWLIPSFSPADIPADDGWRLLCNRIIEQLEVVGDFAEGREQLSREVHYGTVKLYLDMATSLLLFAGAYVPTYRERARKLRRLAETADNDKWPFPLRNFADLVTACTHWKLSGTPTGGSTGWWQLAREHAHLLWRWELVRLTHTSDQLSDRALLERWMRLQPPPERLRGWIYVLRNQGWLRSWRNWPRWGRLAWRASPRYWVYAAGSELFFGLSSLVTSDGHQPQGNLDFERLRNSLPVLPEREQRAGQGERHQLASDILWSYRQFLVETRA